MNRIGLHDIAFYIPSPEIALDRIIAHRSGSDPAMQRRLSRGLGITGQTSLHFPTSRDDTVSMAANAAQALLDRRDPGCDRNIRYLVSGTESAIDHSKPASSWVQGMLGTSGHPLPSTLAAFQVQHACAGGTLGLLSALGLLQAEGRPEAEGLILCSDIARYESPSSAEITQGAGAAALLAGMSPRLLEIDLANPGYSSRHVDDFFRPLDSITARVKGQYSVQCYHQAAEEALSDLASRTGTDPGQVLASHDYLVFHVPFARMALTAARHLLHACLGLDEAGADRELENRCFFPPLDYTARVGNIYTASIWLNLAATLQAAREKDGPGICGRKVLMFSYGSGNIMAVLSGTIAPGAGEVIDSWNLDRDVLGGTEASLEDYLAWTGSDPARPVLQPDAPVPPGRHVLRNIREDGFREYAFGGPA